MATEVEGYVEITISNKVFRLNGDIGDTVEVGWRNQDVELGTIPDVIESVAEALVGKADAQSFADELEKVRAELQGIPGLTAIIEALWTITIYVTDLYIKAVRTDASFEVRSAAFGFRGDFKDQASPLSLGPVALTGFGVVFEYHKSADGVVTSGAVTNPLPTQV